MSVDCRPCNIRPASRVVARAKRRLMTGGRISGVVVNIVVCSLFPMLSLVLRDCKTTLHLHFRLQVQAEPINSVSMRANKHGHSWFSFNDLNWKKKKLHYAYISCIFKKPLLSFIRTNGLLLRGGGWWVIRLVMEQWVQMSIKLC